MTASTFSQDVADAILNAIADGTSVSKACEQSDLPRRTLRGWMAQNAPFKAALEVARLDGNWFLEDKIERLSERAQDIVTEAKARGVNENAAANALRIEIQALQWLLAKRDPARYSDRVASQVELTGRGGKDLIPPPETDRTKLALALMNIIRGADPLPERPLPAPEPPLQIEHEPLVPMGARDF